MIAVSLAVLSTGAPEDGSVRSRTDGAGYPNHDRGVSCLVAQVGEFVAGCWVCYWWGEIRPDSYASTTAWARSRRWSFIRIRPTCVFVVCSAMNSVWLISALDMPRAISRRTSSSRAVRSSRVWGLPGGGSRRAANSAISRLVIEGASSASPRATT